MSVPEHEMLCGLDGPLGELFRWLDMQAHEHGPQPLAALQVAWEAQPFQALAEQLMALDAMQPHGRVVEDPEIDRGELRHLMLALRLDVLGEMLKEVQALPPTDPTRSQRQAELIQEQFSLKRQQMHLKMPLNPIM